MSAIHDYRNSVLNAERLQQVGFPPGHMEGADFGGAHQKDIPGAANGVHFVLPHLPRQIHADVPVFAPGELEYGAGAAFEELPVEFHGRRAQNVESIAAADQLIPQSIFQPVTERQGVQNRVLAEQFEKEGSHSEA